MEKINIGKNGFIYPMPVTLLGVNVENKANFMTLAWVNRANMNPPVIAMGVNKNHYTQKGIAENKTFSINFPSADLIKETDYCGLVSGRNKDKSEIFDIFYGELETAPMIKQFPLSLECKLLDICKMATNDLITGEITGTYSEEKYLTDGKPDIKKINPLVLTMPDNNYWTIGENAGKAWNIGKSLKK